MPNPEYSFDPEVYKYGEFGSVGLDLWQVKAGSVFSNVIITDSVEEADRYLGEWRKLHEREQVGHVASVTSVVSGRQGRGGLEARVGPA